MKNNRSHIVQKRLRTCGLISFALFWTAVSAICTNGQSNRIIGLVKEVSGDWSVVGSSKTKLAVKDRVPPGAKIVAASSNPAESRIVISLLDDSFVEGVCGKGTRCNATIQLPKSLNIERPQSKVVAENNDFFGRAGRVLQGILGGKKEYRGTLTRSSEPVNAVVKITDGSIDLTPVFQYMENRAYFLRLCPVEMKDNVSCEQQAKIISLNLNDGKVPIIQMTGIAAGAYRLMLYDLINQTYLPKDAQAMVYLCQPANYESMKAAYEEAVTASNRWGSKVEPSQELFLREYLIELAKEEMRQKQ